MIGEGSNLKEIYQEYSKLCRFEAFRGHFNGLEHARPVRVHAGVMQDRRGVVGEAKTIS